MFFNYGLPMRSSVGEGEMESYWKGRLKQFLGASEMVFPPSGFQNGLRGSD
jgi:hypothetical protein